MNNPPTVSVIIPCRNEGKFIGKCLSSIIANDYPKDNIEVLVVDGMSDDETRDIVKKYCQKYSFITFLDNYRKIVPTALNIGIKKAKGEIIMRIDAHNDYEKDYVSKCVKYLQKYEVDNVGGVCVTMPGDDTFIAKSIALALSKPFSVGNSYFRIGSKEPKYVDTVPFGCYKRELFHMIGLFDEDLVRNQDDEFNLRLIKNGGKVLLVPEIVSYYYARDSLLKLWKMYYQYGHYKPLVARKIGAVHTFRQLIPAIFVGSLISSGILFLITHHFLWLFLTIVTVYLSTNLVFSFFLAVKNGIKYFFTLPLIFSTIHFSYGIGYLKGIFDFILLKKQDKNRIEDLPLTR